MQTPGAVIVFLFLPFVAVLQAVDVNGAVEPHPPLASIAEPLALSSTHSPASEEAQEETEIVGFTLKGSKVWERLNVPDLIVLRRKDGQRFLPLLRLLKILALEKEDGPGLVRFMPEGAPLVSLDLNKQELEQGGNRRPVDVVLSKDSDVLEREVYLPADTIAEVFGFDLKWHEAGYEFIGKTNRRLGIWKSPGRSLSGMQVQDIQANLPEPLPPATPSRSSLDFLELKVNAKVITENSFKSIKGGADALQQTFWGRLFNGAYRLQMSEPRLMAGDTTASRGQTSLVMLDKGEWTYRFPGAEVSLGDSAFGLNDLTLPFVRISGVRFNGMTGLNEDELGTDRSRLGKNPNFLRPQIFVGDVARGSQVELIINGRSIDTQEAFADWNSEAGMGRYRFEDVILPPGSLNEVVIVVTEPNGKSTRTQQYIQGSDQLLPAGRLAYLGGTGTGREVRTWDTRGVFGGLRALYGVTEQFTVGGSIGYQEDLYQPISLSFYDPDLRQYPLSSLHVGSQFSWQPSVYGLLGGDLSLSHARQRGGAAALNGSAYKLHSSLFPSRVITLYAQYFNYDSEFFNGQNTRLHDRRGFSANGNWTIHPAIFLAGAFGEIWNNLDGNQDQTLSVGFQNLEIITRPFPTAVLSGGVNRLNANWEEDPRVLYILKLRVTPLPDLTFDGSIATGDSFVLTERPEFLSGLKLPGAVTSNQPPTSVLLRKGVTRNNDVALTYWESGGRERGSLVHTFRALAQDSLRVRTEVGYDLGSENPFLENRTEYIFGGVSRRSLEVLTRYDQKAWTIGLMLNIAELFTFDQGEPMNLTNSRVVPDCGGVKGKVFLDYNGNATLDKGEPGLENVQVALARSTSLTDQDGAFVLPGIGYPGKVRVSLDLKSLPAIYSPTNGIQAAYLSPGNLTEVNLGVIPLVSISGVVMLDQPNNKGKPLSGIRVCLIQPATGKRLADSITASDGTYYLGDVKPGKYYVRIDSNSVPQQYALLDSEQLVDVLPEPEPRDLRLTPLTVLLMRTKQQETF